MKHHPTSTDSSAYTIGLDLGDRRHAACVLNAPGKIIDEHTVTNDREGLAQLSARYPGATLAMETGTHSPWISRFFTQRGHRVYVANARKLRAISKSDTKSDRHDARMLARLCRADPQLLSPVKHRSERCQRALLKIKVRDTLVRSRVAQTNTVRFLLKSLGIQLPAATKACRFVAKARTALDEATQVLVEPLLSSLEHLSEQIKALDLELERMGREEYPVTLQLRQIPGVGPLTALYFVLAIETPQRFGDTRTVGAYLGLVPRRDQSGETDKQLRITKAGNTALRCLLVNCAHYILGPFGPDTALRQTGLRLCERGGAAAKKRAVIAVARKLAVTMLALWKSGQDYEPQPLAA